MNMFSRKNRKGFTLIELIVVIAILAILAAIAVPTFIGITKNAEDTVTLANARTLVTAINAHNNLSYGDSTTYPLISTKPATVGDLETALGNLWPESWASEEATAAFEKITITGGVAAISTTSSTGS